MEGPNWPSSHSQDFLVKEATRLRLRVVHGPRIASNSTEALPILGKWDWLQHVWERCLSTLLPVKLVCKLT